MPVSAADAVHLLPAEVLTEVVELLLDDFFFDYRVQALFGPARPMAKNKFIVKIVEKIRRLGKFTYERQPGTREVTRRYGDAIWTAIFQQYSAEIDDQTIHTLGKIDVPNQRLASEIMADDAMQELLEILSDLLEIVLRTNEHFAVQVLSSSTPTITVQDQTENLDFGVVTNNASTSWENAAALIVKEFETWLSQFRKTSGSYPDLVLIEDIFFSKYLLGNTQLKDFIYRHPEFWSADLGLENFSRPDSPKRFQVMTIPTTYEDENGDDQDYWPEGILSMVRMRSGQRSLKRYTVRDKSNRMQGGTASRMWESEDPPVTHLGVSDASFFGVSNKKDVEIFNLTPP